MLMVFTQEVICKSYDWHTRSQRERYEFPDSWQLQTYTLETQSPLTDTQLIAELLKSFPYKGDETSLERLLEGRKKIVILFDDLSRQTPVYRIAPPIIEKAHAAGITDDGIRFIAAVGSHRMLSEEDFRLKLGDEIVDRYVVENHDCFADDIVDLGESTYGTPVKINRTVMEADLIIGIGMIEKHRFAYASGGAKIIVPGVAHVETIRHNHQKSKPMNTPEEEKFGRVRTGINEATRMLLEHKDLLIINVTGNQRHEVTRVYLGDGVTSFANHVDEALETYALELDPNVFDESGKADLAVLRADTLDPLQSAKAAGGLKELSRNRIFVGNFSDGFGYQGQSLGDFASYEKNLNSFEDRGNPDLRTALENGYAILCSPNLDAKSMHFFDQGMYIASDWSKLVRDLYEILGAKCTVLFFKDAFLQWVR